MGSKTQLTGSELHAAAASYVENRLKTKGGLSEAFGGVWHKTLPIMLGAGRKVSALRLGSLLLELLLLVAAAVFPILARKVSEASAPGASRPTGVGAIADAIQRATDTDYVLAAGAVLLVFGPRLLSALAKFKADKPVNHTPYSDLAAALERMPAIQPATSNHGPVANGVEDSIRLCLSALKVEIAQLIDDENKLTDVTLLEFCDPAGQQMQVRARTANEVTHRAVHSRQFLAYYVAMRGRWFVEHHFTKSKHPFPTKRLTVRGNPDVDYCSVIYLPIMTSERIARANHAGAPELVTVDYCIGVICVHSAKPYRFWRWGDHKKTMGGMGDVAYQRALPYISLITRLIEGGAHRVRAEAP